MRRILIVTSLGVLVALTILLFPFESTVVPAATVTVVDEAGNLMADVVVKQQWMDVAVEDEMHVGIARTNQAGVVSFPDRKHRSMFLKRLLNSVWRIATQGTHASIWPSGTLTAYSNANPHVWGSIGYNSGAWPEQIKLKRWDFPPPS
jgi:hypothetical protein